MSYAPQSLIDLRVFLAEQYGVPRRNFGISGRVTARRPWGFHLGKSDIYGPNGMGDRDYSVRHKRNKDGLTDASAGFDIKVPIPRLKELNEYLLDLIVNGDAGELLFEVIGPHPETGKATRWAYPKWTPTKARADHEWHDHLSFWRDTQDVDKTILFHALFSIVPKPNLPIQLGDLGEGVKSVQIRLNYHGANPPLVVDGHFGQITDGAVRAFQSAHGLVQDGIVGPITWAALEKPPL